MARRFDPRALAVSGEPRLVAQGAEQDNIGHDNFSLDTRGTLVLQPRAALGTRLDWLGRDGRREPSPWPRMDDAFLWALTPDGRSVVYATRNPRDIWVHDRDETAPRRLTFEDRNVIALAVSRDGRRVAIGRQLAFGAYELRVKPLDGSGAEQTLFRGPGLFTLPAAWSADDRWIVTAVSDSTGSFDYWLVPADGGEAPRVFERTPADEFGAAMSPDGRWLAYSAPEREGFALYVVSFPVPEARHQISLPEPLEAWVSWPRAGRELMVIDRRGHLFAIEVQTAPTFRQGAARLLGTLPATSWPTDCDPEGNRVLLGSLDQTGPRAGLEVVMAWPQILGGDR